jgi:isocitrate/isopropylmalate dehydrogenase
MDYLQDDVTWMIHGEPYIGCSANFSPDDFSSFQTVHGTVNPFSGKNIINPIGMVHAVAMCLEYAFDMPQAAQDIERSVRQTLTMGFRTHDIYRGNPKYTLVGTREMVDKVVSELYALHA